MPEIHAIIPARSGSKGIKDKCIKFYKDKPLLAHSIRVAIECPLINKVIVSTDSEYYADIARQYGAEAPFLRPKDISDDLSPDLQFFQHYLQWLTDNKLAHPDLIVQLRPTYPNRDVKLLSKMITQFIKRIDDYDSLRTVVLIKKSAFKMYVIEDDTLEPICRQWKGLNEPYNRCRQELPDCYLHNGCVDIVKSSVILNKGSVTGDKIYPFVMTENNDIDDMNDWNRSLQAINL